MSHRPRPISTPVVEWAEVRVTAPAATVTGFDAWASSYELSALQQLLFLPAQQAALDLARQHMPRPRRVLDVGCGTARLLRHARQQYPDADLVGIDLAWQMIRAAAAVTPAALEIRYVRTAAERLPFARHSFDLLVATMSLRHWADLAAGIAEMGRVLTPGGVLVLAEVFSTWRPPPRTALRRRRRSHADLPADLAGALAAHRLAAIGGDRIPWCRLPDIQVIAAQQTYPATVGRPGAARKSRLYAHA